MPGTVERRLRGGADLCTSSQNFFEVERSHTRRVRNRPQRF